MVYVVNIWAGFIWPKTGTSRRALWAKIMDFQLIRRLGIWLVKRLLATQQGLRFTERVPLVVLSCSIVTCQYLALNTCACVSWSTMQGAWAIKPLSRTLYHLISSSHDIWLLPHWILIMSLDSSVNKVPDYGLKETFSIPIRGWGFPLHSG
jgi:hypothetical protein